MADSIKNEAPPQPQVNDIQNGEADTMAIVTQDNHHDDVGAKDGSLDLDESSKVDKTVDAPSAPQDVAPTDTANANAHNTPTSTPGPVAATPVPPAAVSAAAAAGSPARAPTPIKTEPIAPVVSMPAEAAPHGAPTRVYLNTKVTQHVLEGMKLLALKKPDQPLRVLGEFLLKRSQELESPVVLAGSSEEDKDPAADESMNDVEQ